MSVVNTLEIYEVLRKNMDDAPSKAITEVIEKSFEQYREDQKEFLATKTDLAELKAELIKWMFIFWIGQVGVTVGLVLAFIKR